MERRAKGLLALVAVLVLSLWAATVSQAHVDPPPPGFFGVVPQALPTEADYARMQGSVETLRMPIYWFEVEPAPGVFDFAAVDAEIGAAAEHGIRVLPFVYGTPSWVGPVQAQAPLEPPALAEWQGFLKVLIARYGPGGSFWAGRVRSAPVRRWQIWNEPNFRLFWAPKVEPAGYAKLLRVSATTIRAADPAAKIVLAGIAPVGDGMKTWVFMKRLLAVPGVRHDFDFAAVHPYSASIPELDYQLEKVRAAMVAGGAGGKPLIVTEFGVASHGDYPSAFIRGEAGEASFLRDAYARLLQMHRRWRIAGAYWYTWQDEAAADPHCAFCQGAGLLDLAGQPKAAWSAYRRTVVAARRSIPRARAARPGRKASATVVQGSPLSRAHPGGTPRIVPEPRAVRGTAASLMASGGGFSGRETVGSTIQAPLIGNIRPRNFCIRAGVEPTALPDKCS